MPFNIFLLRYTVFYWVVDWLGLEVPWFPWCRNSRRNQFSFHQNVFMLSWIFPGRKWFFGVTFVVFWSNNLTANVMFKFFLVTETNKVSGLTISKMSVMSVIFILYFFEYSNILFSYQVRKSYWGLYSRTESIFRKLIVTFLYV